MSRKNDTFIARRSIPVSCRGPDFSWWNTSGRKMSRRGICIHRTPAGGELWRMTALTRYFINMHQLEQALFFNFEELVYSFFLPPECSSVLFQIYIPSAWTWLITLSTIYNSPDSAPLLFLKKNKQKKRTKTFKATVSSCGWSSLRSAGARTASPPSVSAVQCGVYLPSSGCAWVRGGENASVCTGPWFEQSGAKCSSSTPDLQQFLFYFIFIF